MCLCVFAVWFGFCVVAVSFTVADTCFGFKAYLVMSAADWMQGSYVYAVYDEFGYSMSDIAILYVADFASALLIGTFVAR